MTICAGFICTDGLLLTADTEVTGDGKYNASKIRRLSFSAGEYVITGAGNMSFIGMASDMIAEDLYDRREEFEDKTEAQENKNLLSSIVRNVMLSIHQNHIGSYPYQDTPPWLTLILGFHIQKPNEELSLLHCGGDGGVYWSDEDIFEGSGASIARVFSNILCGERLPIEVMRPMSIFLLHQAKLGAVGCGGSSHTFVLPNPKNESLWVENEISELPHLGMRLCLVDARDMRITKEEFHKRLEDFRARVIAIREALEHNVISHKFIMEVLRKQSTPLPIAPGPLPEQSGGAAPGSGS